MHNILNRDELVDEARRVPFLDALVRGVSGGVSPTRVERIRGNVSASKQDWLVVRCAGVTGFAVQVDGLFRAKSELRRRLVALEVAQALATSLVREQDEYELTDSETPPGEWAKYQVSLSEGVIQCAISPEAPDLLFRGLHVAPKPRTVLLPLSMYGCISEVHRQTHYKRGDNIRVFYLRAEIPDLSNSIQCMCNGEGSMTIEVQNEEESQAVEADPFGVRIDLGEIRLSLDMLTALRAGTAIELDTTFPTECYLRIGATTLAKGMVRNCDNGLTIDIEEVFS